jgi:hypothetical protein
MLGNRRRFTIKHMMVAVALVSILFGAAIEVPRLWTLRRQYLGFAQGYGYWETRYHGAANIRQEITYYSTSLPRGPEPSANRIQTLRDRAAHYGKLRAKYEHAARYPWLTVEPDTPLPPDLASHSR